MITMFLILVFGTIGGALGEFAFDQHCIIGSIIGVVIAIAIRFGGGEGAGGIADGFSDFGGFDSGD